MKKKFSKIGSYSYGIIIPKKILDILGFDVEGYVDITTKNGKIIIESVKKINRLAKLNNN